MIKLFVAETIHQSHEKLGPRVFENGVFKVAFEITGFLFEVLATAIEVFERIIREMCKQLMWDHYIWGEMYGIQKI